MNILDFKTCLDNIQQKKLDLYKEILSNFDRVILLGNGGSNAICSHISQDYTKFLKKKAISFSDSSRLTCYINDFGMDIAYKKFLEDFCEKNTLVILISSSGNSMNIINSALFCVENKFKFIILSGFDENNKLNSFSDKAEISFWIDSRDYGIVEILHETILHSVI